MIKKIIHEYKSDKKNRIIINNMLGAFLIRGLALFVSLYTLPAYIKYFDNLKVLGLWFTVLSVLSWILTFDLGIGNGLRNQLVHTLEYNDKILTRKLISSAYIANLFVVVFISIIGILIIQFVDINSLFKVETSLISAKIMKQSFTVLFVGIMLQFWLRLIKSILYSIQKSVINNLLSLIITVIQLLYVLIFKGDNIESNLLSLSFAHVIITNIPLIIVTVLVFNTKLKKTFSFKSFSMKHAKSTLKFGGLFLWASLMFLIIEGTNEFLITQYYGTEFVVEYSIYKKIFMLFGTLFALALTPLWSVITKSVAEHNYEWLRITYNRMRRISLISIGMQIFLVFIMQYIVDFWLKENSIVIDNQISIIFAIYGGLFIYQNILSTFVCGIGRLKVQISIYTIGVIIKLIAVHLLSKIIDQWSLVVFLNAFLYLVYVIFEQINIRKFFIERNSFNNLEVTNND